jgi:DNA-directed RNA polymerase specialized sigma24 family protein
MNTANMLLVSDAEIVLIRVKMLGVGRKYGFQNADCENLCQDVLEKACRKYKPAKGASFSTFCWILFNHLTIDGLRKVNHRFNKKLKSIAKFEDKEGGNNRELKAPRVNSMNILKLHLKDHFDANKITRKEHDCLVLRCMGYDFSEIAFKLDISVGSAHGTYQKGLAMICEDDGILGAV